MGVRYTVTWEQELRDQMAERWIAAPSHERQRLTEISDRIDCALRFAPQYRGRRLTGPPHFRIWRVPRIVPPALVIFEVRANDRIVNVVQILLLP
jgi:hypothetical protein